MKNRLLLGVTLTFLLAFHLGGCWLVGKNAKQTAAAAKTDNK
jgi:hypothetical protein